LLTFPYKKTRKTYIEYIEGSSGFSGFFSGPARSPTRNRAGLFWLAHLITACYAYPMLKMRTADKTMSPSATGLTDLNVTIGMGDIP